MVKKGKQGKAPKAAKKAAKKPAPAKPKKKAAPKKAAPKKAAPKKAAPTKTAPKQKAPEKKAPEKKAPEKKAAPPQKAAPPRKAPPSPSTLAAIGERIGPGPAAGGFLTLFTPELDQLAPAIDAWDFLLPARRDTWRVIGRNAHGALLVADEREARVRVLDPTMCWAFEHPRLDTGRLDVYLRDHRLPFFLDDSIYTDVKPILKPGEVLGIQRSRPMMGPMEPQNFEREDLVEHHRRVAAECRAAFVRGPTQEPVSAIATEALRAALSAQKGLPRGGPGGGPVELILSQLELVSKLHDPTDDEPRQIWARRPPLVEARAEMQYFLASGLVKSDEPRVFPIARRTFLAAAADGDTHAAHAAAQMMMWGVGGDADLKRAEAALTVAALSGSDEPRLDQVRLLLRDPAGHAQAVRSLEEIAAHRDAHGKLTPAAAEAMYVLGLAYHNGWAVAVDLARSRELHQHAAEAGVAAAQFELAIYLDKGMGGPADPALSRDWERRAAEAGFARSCLNMGVWHATGNGVPKDMDASVRWYEAAARGGNVVAAERQALMFSSGSGVAKDEERAQRWGTFAKILKEVLAP
jgi:TPR repeat protein